MAKDKEIFTYKSDDFYKYCYHLGVPIRREKLLDSGYGSEIFEYLTKKLEWKRRVDLDSNDVTIMVEEYLQYSKSRAFMQARYSQNKDKWFTKAEQMLCVLVGLTE